MSSDGTPIDEVLRRPKRLALLAYLAIATPAGFHRRDSLVALFWPELDQERGRAALRQAIHGLDKALGPGTIMRRGAGEIALDTNRIWCDVLEFNHDLAARRINEALSLYGGDALVGLFVPGSGQELDEWMMHSRERLRTSAVNAALDLARDSLSAGDHNTATNWASWAVQHSPDDEKVVRNVMSLLAAAGDRAGALRTYEHFAMRLRADLEADPSSETSGLANTIRSDTGVPAAASQLIVPTAPSAASTFSPRPAETQRVRGGYVWAAGAIVTGLAIVAFARNSSGSMTGRFNGHTLIAGPIAAASGSGLEETSRIIPAMLTEQLAHNQRLKVIDRMRVLELHAEHGTSPDSVRAALKAARSAGADLMLSGTLHRRGNNALVLRLRVEDLNGREVADRQVTGRSVEELVSRVVGRRSEKPANRTDAVVTHRAWRLYDEGLRELARGQQRNASTLLAESLTLDSTHALTSFYLNRALDPAGEIPSMDLLRRAVRMSTSASPVDRLRIRAKWADATNDPLVGQLTDSLLALAPYDPHAMYASAIAKLRSGQFTAAIDRLKRIVEVDSISRRLNAETCLACKALTLLSAAYSLLDSTDAVIRVQRELVEREPDKADVWRGLSRLLARVGRNAEAQIARQRALTLRPEDSAAIPMDDAVVSIAREEYTAADAKLKGMIESPRSSAEARRDAMWWRSISLRQQGRFREALGLLRRMRTSEDPRHPNTAAILHEAQIYAELGDWRKSYSLFNAASRVPSHGADLASSYGRHRAWTLSHIARARTALKDTVGLAELADTVRNLGAMSTYGRDWKLHYFVRGLVFEARGDTAAAISAYRRSIYSPVYGFTLANVHLARLLLAQRRPRDAADILRPALNGGRDASNLYVTATELHELLAHAFDVAGGRDSARVHYQAVARAWRGAESPWRSRAEVAAKRAASLGAED